MSELELLREQLEGCETDLIQYKNYAVCGDPALEANWAHKLRQAESLRARIRELEEKENRNSQALGI